MLGVRGALRGLRVAVPDAARRAMSGLRVAAGAGGSAMTGRRLVDCRDRLGRKVLVTGPEAVLAALSDAVLAPVLAVAARLGLLDLDAPVTTDAVARACDVISANTTDDDEKATVSNMAGAGRAGIDLAGPGEVPEGWGSVLRPDEQAMVDPDGGRGPRSMLTHVHDEFVADYLRQNPQIENNRRNALGNPSPGLQAELDRSSAQRSAPRAGPGFDGRGQRTGPHMHQPLHAPGPIEEQRPGESHFAWTQRRATWQTTEMSEARAWAAEHARRSGLV